MLISYHTDETCVLFLHDGQLHFPDTVSPIQFFGQSAEREREIEIFFQKYSKFEESDGEATPSRSPLLLSVVPTDKATICLSRTNQEMRNMKFVQMLKTY